MICHVTDLGLNELVYGLVRECYQDLRIGTQKRARPYCNGKIQKNNKSTRDLNIYGVLKVRIIIRR